MTQAGTTIQTIYENLGTSFTWMFTAIFDKMPALITALLWIMAVFVAMSYAGTIVGWVKNLISKMRSSWH